MVPVPHRRVHARERATEGDDGIDGAYTHPELSHPVRDADGGLAAKRRAALFARPFYRGHIVV